MEFAKSHSLVFNAAKTLLICFSQKPSTVNLDRVNLVFLDSALTFNSAVTHLGHILRSDLLDDDDIVAVTWDMCWKANCILHAFSCCETKKNRSAIFPVVHECKRYFNWFIAMYTEQYFQYYINIAHYVRYGNKAQFGTFILHGFMR